MARGCRRWNLCRTFSQKISGSRTTSRWADTSSLARQAAFKRVKTRFYALAGVPQKKTERGSPNRASPPAPQARQKSHIHLQKGGVPGVAAKSALTNRSILSRFSPRGGRAPTRARARASTHSGWGYAWDRTPLRLIYWAQRRAVPRIGGGLCVERPRSAARGDGDSARTDRLDGKIGSCNKSTRSIRASLSRRLGTCTTGSRGSLPWEANIGRRCSPCSTARLGSPEG